MSEYYDQREALHQLSKDSSLAVYDVQALRSAAEFFENLATGVNPAPLALAQAIRRAIPHVEMEAWVDEEMDRKMTPEEAAEREQRAETIRLKIKAVMATEEPPVGYFISQPSAIDAINEAMWADDDEDTASQAQNTPVITQENSPEAWPKNDSEALAFLENNRWDLRCVTSPADEAGCSDVLWAIIGHFMDMPQEREMGFGDTPLDAIRDAILRVKP